jgi:diguanylate cyclase (GGDEF)-like protein/PAS domain S-box-containing protein
MSNMDTSPYAALSKYMDLLLDAICVVDKEGRYVYVSASFERIFGYTPEDVIGTRMIELVHPEDRERTLQTASGIMAGNHQFHFENRYVRKDGQIVHIMWSARWSEELQIRVAVARDITRRKRAEAMRSALYAISEATHAAEDLQTLFEQMHRIVGELLPVSHFSVALYDEKTGEVRFPYYVDEHTAAPAPHQLDADTLYAKVIRSSEPLLITSDEAAGVPAQLREPALAGNDNAAHSWLGVPLESGNGTIGALVVQSTAANTNYTESEQELLQFMSTQIAAAIERKQMIAGLQQAALYDGLTRLPNRALFHDRMQLALARVRRGQVQLSLLYLDLDKFKEVNDSLGHGAGDLLLQKVARRLEQCVRAEDTVARFGGDEFVVLLENVGSPAHTMRVIAKIRDVLNQPFDIAGQEITVLSSIGVAHCPLHGDDEKQLLRHADEAMYLAKHRGGNQFQIGSEVAAK